MVRKTTKKKNEIVIYQAKTGAIELRGDFSKETIWATLYQIADVFGRDKSVISRHLQNIYKENELDEKATVAKNATVQLEGANRAYSFCRGKRSKKQRADDKISFTAAEKIKIKPPTPAEIKKRRILKGSAAAVFC